ncbi:MAG: uridine kinase [Oenococcus sp.]|uniref:uridine kinase n=1 Tax=Oenococcus sp. TaxID=1979414 RepID=UPI0039EBFEB0
MAKTIVIRGNSGSGKTTVANRLHALLGAGNLLISQDLVRRGMLKVADKPHNLAIGLIQNMLIYGQQHCDYVILEGILPSSKYGQMLRQTLLPEDDVFTYYYDLPFQETLKRHQSKQGATFGEKEMAAWFIPHDVLGLAQERIIDETVSPDDLLKIICQDIGVAVGKPLDK